MILQLLVLNVKQITIFGMEPVQNVQPMKHIFKENAFYNKINQIQHQKENIILCIKLQWELLYKVIL